MPTIAEFYGIIIMMFYRGEHNPPHFHAYYAEEEVAVEIESLLSLHPAVSEVAVVGLPDARWGSIVAAFIKRRAPVTAEDLDAHCKASGLANFKRPRRIIFVADLPKSPVGKLLRRSLVSGDYKEATP